MVLLNQVVQVFTLPDGDGFFFRFTGVECGQRRHVGTAFIDGYNLSRLVPIFPDTFYRLTHYWFAAVDIPVANDTPVHYADAIRCNIRRPLQSSLPLLTRPASV